MRTEKKPKRPGRDPIIALTLFFVILNDGMDLVVLAVGTQPDLAYLPILRRCLFRHSGGRTGGEREMVTSTP